MNDLEKNVFHVQQSQLLPDKSESLDFLWKYNTILRKAHIVNEFSKMFDISSPTTLEILKYIAKFSDIAE